MMDWGDKIITRDAPRHEIHNLDADTKNLRSETLERFAAAIPNS
jgi:hypothetical protein